MGVTKYTPTNNLASELVSISNIKYLNSFRMEISWPSWVPEETVNIYVSINLYHQVGLSVSVAYWRIGKENTINTSKYKCNLYVTVSLQCFKIVSTSFTFILIIYIVFTHSFLITALSWWELFLSPSLSHEGNTPWQFIICSLYPRALEPGCNRIYIQWWPTLLEHLTALKILTFFAF